MHRNGKKWTIPETLKLQREYELLKMSVPDIASLHGRSEKAILFKVEAEGWTQEVLQDSQPVEMLSTEESNEIRIYKLEFAVEEIMRTIKDITTLFFGGKKNQNQNQNKTSSATI